MLPGQKLVNGHISVEPLPPLWLLYCKSAERVHRPGSRRLGGVEATGASPGVAPSRPHRSGPRAGPGRRTPCARGAWGGERAGGWASDLPVSLKYGGGPGLCSILWRFYRRSFVRRGRWGKRVPDRSSCDAPRASRHDGPKNRKMLPRAPHRFPTAFRSRECFGNWSRGVLRDEAPTISSTDLGDRAEH